MAIRKVLVIGDELLRKQSKPVDVFDDRLASLLDDMKETLIKENGAGLAAVQVGVLKRVFIMLLDETGLVELVNPEIIKSSEKTCIRPEGCLSVPKKRGDVERPVSVTAQFQDRNGEVHTKKFSGFPARCFCHEYDHLNGILYVDKLAPKPQNNSKGE